MAPDADDAVATLGVASEVDNLNHCSAMEAIVGKKILILASNYGLWGEELQAPWDILKAAGHELQLATYKGVTPLPNEMSMDPAFIDPMQGVAMNPPETLARINEILDTGEWDHPIKTGDANMDDYDALVMVGGAGSALDIVGNMDVHRLILQAFQSDKIVGGLCYAVGALAFTRNPANGKSVVHGKRMVAHPHAWDFVGPHPYTCVRSTADNPGIRLVTNGFLFPLQPLMEDAAGSASFVRSDPKASRANPQTEYDHPFVTGLSVESSTAYGHKLVEAIG
jgi:putative intracellular protease/amidase